MTPLGALLRDLIGAEGPMGLDRFMALALGHPAHGYYVTRDPLGAAGDFTTAPEISQMFGELLGLWAAEVWAAMDRPERVLLVELGPGRGTLMADALRAARAAPGFLPALAVHLVETSPALREHQAAALGGAPVPVRHHERLATVPPGPAIVIANEFLDALPIRQFVRKGGSWHERLVGLEGTDRLAFGLAPEPEPGLAALPGPDGAVLERGEAAAALVRVLAERLRRDGGAALLVDYGHDRTAFGDTLQAVRAHRFADPLAEPGEADLTAHVDFAAVARAARGAGAAVHGPVAQGRLLRALGIDARAAALSARPENGAAVAAAHRRLVGEGEGEMGRLFRVLGLSHPGLRRLPGLPGPEADAPFHPPAPRSAAC